MASGQPNDTGLRREEQGEFGVVGQEEFESREDGHRVSGRILMGELGEQGEGAAQERWLLHGQPDLHSTQVAPLACPGRSDPSQGLPQEALMMDVERDHAQGGARVDPAIGRSHVPRWKDCAAVELKTQASHGKVPDAY